MIKQKFTDTATEFENDRCVVTIYNNHEIISRFKLNIINIDEYDDEFIIYGDNNDFVILDCNNIIQNIDGYDEIEFLFGSGSMKIGISFL